MSHRVNWMPTSDKSQFNFLWKYSIKKIKYNNNSHKSTRLINLFENHEELTTKKGMFLNLISYCNVSIFK